jgi:ribosomal protein S18 acetylase RimI-like enzyme
VSDGTRIRNALPGDLNYLFATTLRDMRDADGSALPDHLWYPAHRAYLEESLADPAVACLVLCAEDDPNEILGFVIARPGEEMLWLHVRKGPLRGRGLGRRLMTEARVLDAPAAWMTPLGRRRLRNPWRGRKLRRRSSPR